MGGLVHRAAGCVGVGDEDVHMVTVPGGKAVEGDGGGTWGSRRQLGPRIRRPPKNDPFGVVQPDPSLVGDGWCNRDRIVWSLIVREGGGGAGGRGRPRRGKSPGAGPRSRRGLQVAEQVTEWSRSFTWWEDGREFCVGPLLVAFLRY